MCRLDIYIMIRVLNECFVHLPLQQRFHFINVQRFHFNFNPFGKIFCNVVRFEAMDSMSHQLLQRQLCICVCVCVCEREREREKKQYEKSLSLPRYMYESNYVSVSVN